MEFELIDRIVFDFDTCGHYPTKCVIFKVKEVTEKEIRFSIRREIKESVWGETEIAIEENRIMLKHNFIGYLGVILINEILDKKGLPRKFSTWNSSVRFLNKSGA